MKANVQSTGNTIGRRMRASTSSSSRASGVYKRTPYDFINSFFAVLHRWRQETAFESNADVITSHVSYRALVENADAVTPLIVEELRRNPSKLVWVLEDAFKITPYDPENAGDIEAMSESWIAWAEKNGRALQSLVSTSGKRLHKEDK